MNNYRIVQLSVAFNFKKGLQRLEEEVSAAMKEGWKPTGGPVVHGSYLFQALVRDR